MGGGFDGPREGDLEALQIVVGNTAKRELKKLPKAAQAQITKALEKLSTNPRPRGAEKLQGHPAFFRIRCGEYRIIYAVRADIRHVVVVVIRDRKDAFKGLEQLDSKLASALIMVVDRMLDKAPFGITISTAPGRLS